MCIPYSTDPKPLLCGMAQQPAHEVCMQAVTLLLPFLALATSSTPRSADPTATLTHSYSVATWGRFLHSPEAGDAYAIVTAFDKGGFQILNIEVTCCVRAPGLGR